LSPHPPRPVFIVCETAQEMEAVQDAIMLLMKYPGVLAESPNGWMLMPRQSATQIVSRETKERPEMSRYTKILAVALVTALALTGCDKPADVASTNLSNMADNFLIERRIVFINGITDKVIATIEGRCSLGNSDKPREISVTCKVGANPDLFIKDFVGLSDNVTYFVDQTKVAEASTYHYRVNFAPEQVIPDVVIS
jgi:hypothetical protein